MIWTIVTAVVLAALLTLSHGIMKWVSIRLEGDFLAGILSNWLQIGAAVAIYLFVFIYYIYALRNIKLAVLYPIYTGLSVVLVFALGTLRFAEPVTAINIVGCALIVIGVALVVQ